MIKTKTDSPLKAMPNQNLKYQNVNALRNTNVSADQAGTINLAPIL